MSEGQYMGRNHYLEIRNQEYSACGMATIESNQETVSNVILSKILSSYVSSFLNESLSRAHIRASKRFREVE